MTSCLDLDLEIFFDNMYKKKLCADHDLQHALIVQGIKRTGKEPDSKDFFFNFSFFDNLTLNEGQGQLKIAIFVATLTCYCCAKYQICMCINEGAENFLVIFCRFLNFGGKNFEIFNFQSAISPSFFIRLLKDLHIPTQCIKLFRFDW